MTADNLRRDASGGTVGWYCWMDDGRFVRADQSGHESGYLFEFFRIMAPGKAGMDIKPVSFAVIAFPSQYQYRASLYRGDNP